MVAVESRASGAGGTVEEGDILRTLQVTGFKGTVGQYMKEMGMEAAGYGRHSQVRWAQHGSYQCMWEEETMVPGMLYIIMDFAMNYSHEHLTETQTEFFA